MMRHSRHFFDIVLGRFNSNFQNKRNNDKNWFSFRPWISRFVSRYNLLGCTHTLSCVTSTMVYLYSSLCGFACYRFRCSFDKQYDAILPSSIKLRLPKRQVLCIESHRWSCFAHFPSLLLLHALQLGFGSAGYFSETPTMITITIIAR